MLKRPSFTDLLFRWINIFCCISGDLFWPHKSVKHRTQSQAESQTVCKSHTMTVMSWLGEGQILTGVTDLLDCKKGKYRGNLNTHQHVDVWIKPLCYPGNLGLLGTGNTETTIVSSYLSLKRWERLFIWSLHYKTIVDCMFGSLQLHVETQPSMCWC